MRVQLFAIHDRKTFVYLSPFASRSQVDAIRQIKSSFKDPAMLETPVGQHPEDFDLYHVAAFDDETGEIFPCKPPMLVATLATLRE